MKSMSERRKNNMVDIITFCEGKDYLGITLSPWQRLILKFFYQGECAYTLTVEDRELMKKDLPLEVYMQVINKISNTFNQGHIFFGRCGGASALVRRICLYEVYKALESPVPGFKTIGCFSEFTLLNSVMMSKMRDLISASPYFQLYKNKFSNTHLSFASENCIVRLTESIYNLEGANIIFAAYDNTSPQHNFQTRSFFTHSPGSDTRDRYFDKLNDPDSIVFRLPTWASNTSLDSAFFEDAKLRDPQEFNIMWGASID